MAVSSVTLISSLALSECRHRFVKAGYFYRRCDKRRIQRFQCQLCGKSKSVATEEHFYRQRLRAMNTPLFMFLASAVPQRRLAINFGVNRKTIVRKFRVLGQMSDAKLLEQNQHQQIVSVLEFDDLETFEHSKCKPLSVTLAVEKSSRRVLGFEVSQMPAKGLLAKFSRSKYGNRRDERFEGRERLFTKIKEYLDKRVIIRSDDNPHYTLQVKAHFPTATHITTKGGRGAVTGQGELKKQKFDPLFAINHTFAKCRADISRLVRKTWSTTKKSSQLQLHLSIMTVFHNHRLVDPKLRHPIFGKSRMLPLLAN